MTDDWTPAKRERTDWKKLAKKRWHRIAELLIENERLRAENERLRARYDVRSTED
jgi:hypothetical protein